MGDWLVGVVIAVLVVCFIAIICSQAEQNREPSSAPVQESPPRQPTGFKPIPFPDPDEFYENQETKRKTFLRQGNYLSFTALDTYLRCPYLYYLRYVRGIRVPSSAPQQIGKAVHAGIAYIYECKLTTGTFPPLYKVSRVYERVLREESSLVAEPISSYL